MSWLGNLWKHVKDDVSPFFSEAEKEASSFLEAAAHSLIANGGAVLIGAAKDAVVAAETTGGTNEQKKDAAVTAVVSSLKTNGLPVVMNAVNFAVEAAVAQKNA